MFDFECSPEVIGSKHPAGGAEKETTPVIWELLALKLIGIEGSKQLCRILRSLSKSLQVSCLLFLNE